MTRKRFSSEGFTFEMDAGWESLFLLGPGVRDAVAVRTGELAGQIIKAAPARPHTPEGRKYAVKENIHPYVEEIAGQWVGVVVIEENPLVRHTMLQEQGFTGRDGRRHEGRHFIKAVLESERVD